LQASSHSGRVRPEVIYDMMTIERAVSPLIGAQARCIGQCKRLIRDTIGASASMLQSWRGVAGTS